MPNEQVRRLLELKKRHRGELPHRARMDRTTVEQASDNHCFADIGVAYDGFGSERNLESNGQH